MLNVAITFLCDVEGASAVEYGLIMGLVGVVLVVVLNVLSGGMIALFNSTASALIGILP